jgi:hypothetical protein
MVKSVVGWVKKRMTVKLEDKLKDQDNDRTLAEVCDDIEQLDEKINLVEKKLAKRIDGIDSEIHDGFDRAREERAKIRESISDQKSAMHDMKSDLSHEFMKGIGDLKDYMGENLRKNNENLNKLLGHIQIEVTKNQTEIKNLKEKKN